MSAKATSQIVQGAASGTGHRGEVGPGGMDERAVVEMVSVVEAGLLLGVTDVGLNVQVAAAGKPKQEKVIALGKPPACGVTLIVN